MWGNWLHANATIDDNDVTWAKGSYGLDLNSFDLGLRQQLVKQESFAIDLLAALRYANLKQKTSVYYRQDVTATTYRSATIEDKNNFKGWGPRVGFDMNWKIGHGFSFFNETAGSLLLGNYSLSYSELDRAAGSTTDISRVDINESETRLIPVVEIKVGAGYSRELKNGWIIGANAGYEWQNLVQHGLGISLQRRCRLSAQINRHNRFESGWLLPRDLRQILIFSRHCGTYFTVPAVFQGFSYKQKCVNGTISLPMNTDLEDTGQSQGRLVNTCSLACSTALVKSV